jgi:iron complex outermembrane receptor protein
MNYTFSEFKFLNFRIPDETFDGNFIPGLPQQLFKGAIIFAHPGGFFARLEFKARGEFYTNNENSETEHHATVINFQTGYKYKWAGWNVELAGGINNLLNTGYSDNIRINAFGRRYFEPAPGVNFFGTLIVGRH